MLAGGACDAINGCTVVHHPSNSGNSRSSRYTLYLPGLRRHICASSLDECNANEHGVKFLSALEHYQQQQELVWLDVSSPSVSDLDALASLYKFHPTTRQDIESAEILDQVKFFRHSYFVRVLTANVDPSLASFLKPTQLCVLVSSNNVLTISRDSHAHAHNVWNRISTRSITVPSCPDDICCALIDDVLNSFSTVVNFYRDKSELMEERNCAARAEDNVTILQQIGHTRSQILKLSRLLGGKPDIVRNMTKRVNYHPSFYSQHETKLYLGDIQDHIVTLISNVSHVAELLNRTHACYVAQISVHKYIKGASTNRSALRIAVLATILSPSFLVISLFSMNVHTPFVGGSGYAGFFGMVGALGCYTLLACLLAWWMKYL